VVLRGALLLCFWPGRVRVILEKYYLIRISEVVDDILQAVVLLCPELRGAIFLIEDLPEVLLVHHFLDVGVWPLVEQRVELLINVFHLYL